MTIAQDKTVAYLIGTFTLDADKTFTREYEYAGAGTTIEVPAGKYPLLLKRSTTQHNYDSGWHLAIEFKGTQVLDYFYNRIGGCGSAKVDRTPKPTTYNADPYWYEVENKSFMNHLGSLEVDPKVSFNHKTLVYGNKQYELGH